MAKAPWQPAHQTNADDSDSDYVQPDAYEYETLPEGKSSCRVAHSLGQ